MWCVMAGCPPPALLAPATAWLRMSGGPHRMHEQRVPGYVLGVVGGVATAIVCRTPSGAAHALLQVVSISRPGFVRPVAPLDVGGDRRTVSNPLSGATHTQFV